MKTRGVLVLITLSLFLFFNSAKQFYYYNILGRKGLSNLERIYRFQSSDARLKLKIANTKYRFLLTNNEDSLINYVGTLELNPVLAKAWLGVAESLINENKSNQALLVLKYLKTLAPYSNKVNWDISLLLLQISEYDVAIKTLINVAENNYWKRDDVFRIFDRLQMDKKTIIDHLKYSILIPDYFDHILSSGLVDESIYLWDFIVSNGIQVEENIKTKYIGFLVTRDMFKQAYSLWLNLHENIEDETLIWNGDFEYEIENKGFDWRIKNINEVDIEIDDKNYYSGSKSLKVVFNGKENINFYHVTKYIPIDSGKSYSFSYAYSSADITTKSGLFWEINCAGSRSYEKTNVILGTSIWKRDVLEFETPQDCKGIILALRRVPIRKLDSKISGTVWFDDIQLNALN